MNEIYIIVYVMLSAGLFALGGTTNKLWRRFILPAVTFGFLALNQVDQTMAIVSSVLLGAVLHLGYGESKPWWYKALVGLSYSVPSLLIGLTLWQFVLPVVFLVLFWLSNQNLTQKDVPWKLWELTMGGLIAYTYVGGLMRIWS